MTPGWFLLGGVLFLTVVTAVAIPFLCWLLAHLAYAGAWALPYVLELDAQRAAQARDADVGLAYQPRPDLGLVLEVQPVPPERR